MECVVSINMALYSQFSILSNQLNYREIGVAPTRAVRIAGALEDPNLLGA